MTATLSGRMTIKQARAAVDAADGHVLAASRPASREGLTRLADAHRERASAWRQLSDAMARGSHARGTGEAVMSMERAADVDAERARILMRRVTR